MIFPAVMNGTETLVNPAMARIKFLPGRFRGTLLITGWFIHNDEISASCFFRTNNDPMGFYHTHPPRQLMHKL